MTGWDNFFFAQVGASAALVGLIFVAVSINLTKILASRHLPNRALEALIFLLIILVVASLMLVPDQSISLLGIEILATALIFWTVTLRIDVRIWQRTETQYRPAMRLNMGLNQLTVLLYVIAGIATLVWGAGGIYWLVPSILLSYIKALLDAWVLLVEINR